MDGPVHLCCETNAGRHLTNFRRSVLGRIDASDSESRHIFSAFSEIYKICIPSAYALHVFTLLRCVLDGFSRLFSGFQLLYRSELILENFVILLSPELKKLWSFLIEIN